MPTPKSNPATPAQPQSDARATDRELDEIASRVSRGAEAQSRSLDSVTTQMNEMVGTLKQTAKQAGSLGGGVGKASDSQASFSLGQWSLTRSGTMDVQVAGGRTVYLFSRVFQAALEDCLR